MPIWRTAAYRISFRQSCRTVVRTASKAFSPTRRISLNGRLLQNSANSRTSIPPSASIRSSSTNGRMTVLHGLNKPCWTRHRPPSAKSDWMHGRHEMNCRSRRKSLPRNCLSPKSIIVLFHFTTAGRGRTSLKFSKSFASRNSMASAIISREALKSPESSWI